MNELMRQAARMQRHIDELKNAFKSHTVEVKGANGKVAVTVNGERQVVSLVVNPAFYKDEDPLFVQDSIVGTVNAAMKELESQWDEQVKKQTGGAKVPGVL